MSNQTHSGTTISLEEHRLKTGTPLGERGLAMLVGLPELPHHPTPEVAQDLMRSLQAFSARLLANEAEVDQTKCAIRYLRTPAPRKWIAGRIVTLLSHYFMAQTEVSVAEAVADDWCAMLDDYPAWAIANACRWWMSRENPRKHCKPLPGDIQERVHVEMERVRAAQITAQRGFSRCSAPPDPGPEPMRDTSPEALEARRKAAEEIMAKFTGSRKVDGGEA